MNQFVGKKIGEVMAFSKVGQETLERGNAIADVFGQDTVDSMKRVLAEHYDQLLAVAGDQAETATTKAEATGKKLQTMRDMYIGDEWDNPVEIMEWLGFFEGAAIVHCELVKGAAEGLEHEELENVATAIGQIHYDALDLVKSGLRKTGATKATA